MMDIIVPIVSVAGTNWVMLDVTPIGLGSKKVRSVARALGVEHNQVVGHIKGGVSLRRGMQALIAAGLQPLQDGGPSLEAIDVRAHADLVSLEAACALFISRPEMRSTAWYSSPWKSSRFVNLEQLLALSQRVDAAAKKAATLMADVDLQPQALVQSCDNCGLVAEPGAAPMPCCGLCHRATYCSKYCQRKHWSLHKPTCGKPADGVTSHPCAKCGVGRSKTAPVLRCSRCCVTVYCNADCQRGHWVLHKEVCVQRAPTAGAGDSGTAAASGSDSDDAVGTDPDSDMGDIIAGTCALGVEVPKSREDCGALAASVLSQARGAHVCSLGCGLGIGTVCPIQRWACRTSSVDLTKLTTLQFEQALEGNSGIVVRFIRVVISHVTSQCRMTYGSVRGRPWPVHPDWLHQAEATVGIAFVVDDAEWDSGADPKAEPGEGLVTITGAELSFSFRVLPQVVQFFLPLITSVPLCRGVSGASHGVNSKYFTFFLKHHRG
jgi:hypothetical protein